MVIMIILWYVCVENMIFSDSLSFENFWTTDYVDSKVQNIHANLPIHFDTFSQFFGIWQGKIFLKQGIFYYAQTRYFLPQTR
jgi:hypothetical protein